MRIPRIAEPLRHRDFRLLWIGQTFTIFGTFVTNVAYPFQVLRLGGSATELGLLVSIYSVVNLAFLLVGGAIADRMSRRVLIVVTELASGGVTGGVAVLGALGSLEIWHLYVTYAYFGAASAFSVPAIGAFIPELVPEDVLIPGNALRGLSRQVARIGAPVIGGILVAAVSPAAAFAFDSLTFFISAAAVALTSSRPLAQRASGAIVREIAQGIRFVFSVQWLWFTIFGFSLVNAGFVASIVALPLLVTKVLGADAALFGALSAAMGIGEAVGAILVGQLVIARSGLVMYLFGALGAVAFLTYGAVPTVAGAFAASVVTGFSLVGFSVLWESALQRHVPRALLGRVTSVDWFGGILLGPIAPIVGAAIADSYGPPAVFIVGGTLASGVILTGLLLPSVRRLR
jgi:DHA3 family tetracycline resistance protein-like MFS transporter